jgi:hypothetical protein
MFFVRIADNKKEEKIVLCIFTGFLDSGEND